MSDTRPPVTTPRRSFLGRLAAGAVALGAAGVAPRSLLAHAARAGGPGDPDKDHWLKQLTAKHKQIFDMPNPSGGLPLIHVRNYLNTYRDSFNARPNTDVQAVVSLYFMTVPMAFNDAMWDKYKFGEALKVNDTSMKGAATKNLFATGAGIGNVEAMIPPPGDASIEELRKRGTLFLLCNNATNFWAGNVAKMTSGNADTIKAEWLSNLLPGVVLVPAMVVAFNQAQEHGCSYMYLA